MLCIHVDDFNVAASDNSLIDDLCTALKLKYIIKESESLEDFLPFTWSKSIVVFISVNRD